MFRDFSTILFGHFQQQVVLLLELSDILFSLNQKHVKVAN